MDQNSCSASDAQEELEPPTSLREHNTKSKRPRLRWNHFIRIGMRTYKPCQKGQELQNVTCRYITFPSPGVNIGYGIDHDAVTLHNFVTICTDQQPVNIDNNPMLLTNRKTGAWDLTESIVELATGSEGEGRKMILTDEDGKQEVYITMPHEVLHNVPSFIFGHLGHRAHCMANMPLRLQRDIEQHLTRSGYANDTLTRMTKSMQTCLQGIPAGHWVAHRILHWQTDLKT